MASPSPRLGVPNPTPKLQSLLFQEWLKLGTSNLADIFKGPSEHKPVKNFGEKGAWAYPEMAQIFWVPPIISGTGKATNFTFGRYIQNVSCEQKPVKNLGEKGAWAYPRTAQIFEVPPIISGTGKATNFKFGTYIHRVYPNKSALNIWEQRERGRIQGPPKFLEYPLLSQERVKLRTSNLAAIFTRFIQTKAP